MNDLGAAERILHARLDRYGTFLSFNLPSQFMANFANLVIDDKLDLCGLLFDSLLNYSFYFK